MNKDTKDQLIEVLTEIYQIPGQYFIAGIVLIGIGESMQGLTIGGNILIAFGILFFIIEAVSPIIAGIKLYEKAVKNLKRIF